jgi:hypothetical protein
LATKIRSCRNDSWLTREAAPAADRPTLSAAQIASPIAVTVIMTKSVQKTSTAILDRDLLNYRRRVGATS